MQASYDVVIIGAGPAGEGCAMRATKQGKSVAVIDDKGQVGGACTHLGTIPSKTLRHAVRQIIRFNTDKLFRDIGEPRTFSFPHVLKRVERVVQSQMDLHTNFYAKNRVKLYFGSARFLEPNTLEVGLREGGLEVIKAASVVICTGSRPYRPSDIDFTHSRIYDSDTILSLAHTPRKMIIYGAGVIGCEYASIFCGLGVKVELVNTRDKLLDFLDNEISDALGYHLRDIGVLIRHAEEYEQVEMDDHCVTLHLKSGKKLRADALLWCNGRVGNTDKLDLHLANLRASTYGKIEVNERYQTSVPHIYAAGDVIGWPSLASAAYDQGRSVGSALTVPDEFFRVVNVPTGIYTLPEISSIGKTEQELTKEKVPYEVGQAFFKTTTSLRL